MKRRTVYFSLFLPMCLGSPGPSPGQPSDPESETEAIAQVIRSTTEAFNAHDVRRFASFDISTATLVTVRGERMTGSAEIEKGLGALFATRARNARLQTIETSIAFLAPDVAIGHVPNEMSGVLGPNGDRLPPHRELSLRHFLKTEGKWLVAAFHNTIVQPGLEPRPSAAQPSGDSGRE